jgi:tetratricopeptide (TPR) repeat protein
MPFVRKTDSQGSQTPTDIRKLFIGRTGELLFFVQNILKPEEPTHNIISIWGQGGIGKSTLLTRFIDEAHFAEFKDYCLTATVDEQQTIPASIMEKFATQLHMHGAFEKALKQYKKLLRTQQTEWEILPDMLAKRMPTFAGAAVEGVPFVGPLLGEGVKATAEHLLDRRNNLLRHRDAELLEDPVNELTRVFIDELNRLAESQVLLGSQRVRKLRVILFFDTFEQLADEAAPWLLNYFLPADINASIVLIIAGRDPIERSIPEETKRWLPYIDNEIIYWIPLNSFTEDETRAYLNKRDITDPERINTIWRLSRGLPLYLSLLTSNPQGRVDPAADVVANFLRWIPEGEQIKRQLALDASLFSRPFNQDDLTAFIYLPENELPSLYRWLIAQPFVRSQDGRYSYHDLAQELFSRHLYQRSKKEYDAARRSIVNYYKRLLEEIQGEKGLEVYHLMEYLELVLALTEQWFMLPDEASHLKVIELILKTFQHTDAEQNGEIAKFLRELYERQYSIKINSDAQQTTKHLLQYIEADARSQDRLIAATALLKRVEQSSSFSLDVRAQIYSDRGWAYLRLKEYEQAVSDFNSALALKPKYVDAYNGRGMIYCLLKDYELALAELDRALELDPNNQLTYYWQGLNHLWLKDINQAKADFTRSRELNQTSVYYSWIAEWAGMCQRRPDAYAAERLETLSATTPEHYIAFICRGVAKWLRGHGEESLPKLNQAIAMRPKVENAYFWKGIVCASLGRDEEAIAAIEKSLEEFELPTILLTPLHWFEEDRPEFYQRYVVPLLSRYDLE